MPRRRLAPFTLVLLCALTSIQLTGCTAIGFGVGSLADMSSGKGTPDRLSPVRAGTRVTLWLKDGRKIHGHFLGSSDSLSENPSLERQTNGAQIMAPLRAVLLIGTRHGIQQIPIQNVRKVSVPVARGKLIGLLTGFSVDLVMVLLLAAALAGSDFS